MIKVKQWARKSSILYTYNVKINNSTIESIKKNTPYKIYLCENDVIIEQVDALNSLHIIYQNINSWFYTNKTFGFNFSINNISHKIEFIIDDSIDIRNKIKEITSDLVIYYENL